MFGTYKEKDVMNLKTDIVKRPLVVFDKDCNIKILTMNGVYKIYEIDIEKLEFKEKISKLIID